MKKLTSLILTTFILPIILPVAGGFHVVDTYTYQSEWQDQNLHFSEILEPTASTENSLKAVNMWKRATGTAQFISGQNMFTLRIPKTFVIEAGNNPIRVSIIADGVTFPLNIDMDGDGREEAYYYTEPLFVERSSHISYVIETKSSIQIPSISIIGLDTDAHKSHIAFGAQQAEALENRTGLTIIKRADWGADETLRYRDNPLWKKAFDAIEADKDKPKSEATLKYEAKIRSITMHLATEFPEQDGVIETIRSEGDHSLVWPIEKTKQVERIVIHHTAENNQTSKDDLTLIRGIYYYHTIVRGWGDIGYNYLVGQRGQIYEWRAGGDYNVAAHALWNNKSSVGVSVMGNFMVDSVVSEQEEALKNIVEYLSKKYGIDIHKTSVGHKECKKDDCIMDDFASPNLVGHKEVGFTSCPGDNLFAIVENLRKTETTSLGRSLVLNPHYNSVKIASIGPTDTLTTKPLGKWPTVRIRLSHTGSTIRLKSGDSKLARLTIGANSWVLRKNPELPFEASGSGKIALVLGKKNTHSLRWHSKRISSRFPVGTENRVGTRLVSWMTMFSEERLYSKIVEEISWS